MLKPHKCRDANFKSLQSDELFFKNLRSFYYSKTEFKDKFMSTYLFKDALEDYLNFLIIHQEHTSEWHIRPFLTDSPSVPITFVTSTLSLNIDSANSEDYWFLASAINQDVVDRNSINAIIGTDTIVLLENEDEQKRAEQLLFDYFRLVGCN